MAKKTWTLFIWAGVAVLAAGVIAAVVGFSMDETYPEEVPGWATMIVWAGVAILVGSFIGRSVTKS